MTRPYIAPLATIHTSFKEAGEAINAGDFRFLALDDQSVGVDAIAGGRRTLIVGEPGVGKTLMMSRIAEHLEALGSRVTKLALRARDTAERIESALSTGDGNMPGALLLDGIDEIPSTLLHEVLQKIAAASTAHPEVAIFISGRWVFAKRHAQHLAGHQIVVIHPFTISRVRGYLGQAGHTAGDIDRLLRRVSFGHRTQILQIPRYLEYLCTYMAEKGIDAAAALSRNDLFEHLVYSRLELEDRKRGTDKRALVKRLLEKLALVMEIYGTNVITNDEFMTFLDQLRSDLKFAVIAQVSLEALCDCSALQVSHDDPDKVEFENAEFQEYLAAKEISRSSDANRTAFAFAVDAEAVEVRPSWYNTLTFLVDMRPALLQPIAEFAGLYRGDSKLLEEGFWNFVSLVDPAPIDRDLRTRLFHGILDCHARTLQWLPSRVANALAAVFHEGLESTLEARAKDADTETGARRHVPLANVVKVVGAVLREQASGLHGRQLGRAYWRDKLIAYACDSNVVVQRQALRALVDLGDRSVIAALQDVRDQDKLVSQALLEACVELDPDDPFTLRLVFEGVRRGDLSARRSLCRMRTAESITAFLALIVDDSSARSGLLEGPSSMRQESTAIADSIKRTLNDETRELAQEALVALLHYEASGFSDRASFIPALWRILAEGDAGFVGIVIRRLDAIGGRELSVFHASHLIAESLEERDIAPFLAVMRDFGDLRGAMMVMEAIKRSDRPGCMSVYEAGRIHAPDAYADWEAPRPPVDPIRNRRRYDVLEEFRTKLQRRANDFRTDVFEYYNSHGDELDARMEPVDRERLREIITIVLRTDPADHGLTLSNGGTSFTRSSLVPIFEDAVAAARRLGMNVADYRPAILSLIPFAFEQDLQLIFELLPNIGAGELDRVLAVYTRRDSDLWRHRPGSLVAAAERYHAVDAVPVLRALVLEPAIDGYARERALRVAEALAPDPSFLRDVFERHRGRTSTDGTLADAANALLIMAHADRIAAAWRLEELWKRSAPLRRRGGSARRGPGPVDEVSFGRNFAEPLMALAQPGHEEACLRLLEKATALWTRGGTPRDYAEWVWEIVYAYFDNLKGAGSYGPLRRLEATVGLLTTHDGANWLAAKMVPLRRSYLHTIGRPRTIADAVSRHNEICEWRPTSIRTTDDLFQHLKDAIDTDLRRWVEGEGAYSFLTRESKHGGTRRRFEDFVQKTVKDRLETILARRGLQIDVVREPQMYDDKRVDILVRYGFAGPVVIEVKLTSSSDLQTPRLAETRSHKSMRRYMSGYGASCGIFLVFVNSAARNLTSIKDAYEQIPNVSVLTLDCAVRGARTSSSTAGKRRSRSTR